MGDVSASSGVPKDVSNMCVGECVQWYQYHLALRIILPCSGMDAMAGEGDK